MVGTLLYLYVQRTPYCTSAVPVWPSEKRWRFLDLAAMLGSTQMLTCNLRMLHGRRWTNAPPYDYAP